MANNRTVFQMVQFLLSQRTCRRFTVIVFFFSFFITFEVTNPKTVHGARTYTQPPTLSWIPDYPDKPLRKNLVPSTEPPTLSVAGNSGTTSSFYGNIAASTHFATELSGNKFEFLDTFILPTPLQLNHVRGGTDLGDDNYGEIDLNNIGADEFAFILMLRSVSRGDLYSQWHKSSWDSDGRDLRATREEQLLGGYLRGLEQPRIAAEISLLEETGTTETGPRNIRKEAMWLGFLSSSNALSIEGAVYTDEFQDNLDRENDVNTLNMALSLEQILGGKNLVSMDISHNKISKDQSDESVENTDISLMGIAYGPFNVDSMKLRGKVRYMTQPSSFVANGMVDNLFETDVSFLFKSNSGALSGGMKSKDMNVSSLSRAAIEDFILTSSNKPSISYETDQYDSSHKSDWLKATILGGKNYKLTAGTSITTLNNQAPSEWVQSGSASLAIDRMENSDVKLTILPRRAFNVALSQRDERRHWSDVRRAITGQTYLRRRSILCNLPPVGKLTSSIDQSTTNFSYPDEDGGFSSNEDSISTGIHGGYAVNNSWKLFVDHLQMKNDGPSESREEFTTFGISYDSQTSKAISFEIAYGRDKFSDYIDSGKNFYAKSLTLSTEAKF